MGKVVDGLLGGGGKTSKQPIEDTEEAKKKAQQMRPALYETSGGAYGEELNPEEVSRRRTLLGN